MPIGEEVYCADSAPVIARGLSYTDQHLDEMLHGVVKDILNDDAGTNDLKELISTVVSTDFEHDGLEELLTDNTKPENWRVGEAIAEGFVVGHGDCFFPWPTGRDLKNPNASPAGCDLTGFRPTGDDDLPYRFAFGEVKTSEQKAWPPNVVYGRHGLQKQLEGLRDDRKVKDALCCYLGHRAFGTEWLQKYKSAAKRYLQSDTEDVALYGVLLRDVEARPGDLSQRATTLSLSCPNKTAIELYALYLPRKSISELSTRAVAANNDGRAQ